MEEKEPWFMIENETAFTVKEKAAMIFPLGKGWILALTNKVLLSGPGSSLGSGVLWIMNCHSGKLSTFYIDASDSCVCASYNSVFSFCF